MNRSCRSRWPRRRSRWSAWLALVPALASAAAAQQYPGRQYTVDDGLPSGQVRDITQDAGGRIWIATRAGSAVYDGRAFITYGLKDGLTWADQFALRWDQGGTLWSVGSFAPFPVYRFEAERWQAQPASAAPAAGARVTAFAARGSGEGVSLVIGTAEHGVQLWADGAWRAVRRADGLPGERVVGAVADGDAFLVATTGGLARLRAGAPPAIVDQPWPGAIAALAARAGGSDARLWVIGDHWLGTLADDRLTVHGRDLPLDWPEGGGPRLAVPDRRGGLFLGDGEVCYHVDPEAGVVERLDRNSGLLADGVTALFLDREDNLWAGSGRGVAKLTDRRFGRFGRRHGLLDDEVTATLERRDGSMVLGHRGGISILRGGHAEARALPPPAGYRLVVEPIRDLAEDAAGTLWLAAGGYGLGRLGGDGAVTWWGPSEGLRGSVSTVLAGADGSLLAATDEGIFHFHGGRFAAHSPDQPTRARRLFADAEALYLATGDGLLRFDAAGAGRWRRYDCAESGCESVFAVLPASDGGGPWVGTSAGLWRLDAERVELVRDGAAPAIERPIFFLARDHQGRLWMGCDNGVLRWDGDLLHHFTVADGLAGRETYRAAGMVDSQGRVWIGTERGVTVYREGPPGPPRGAPIVSLVGVEAAGRMLSAARDHRITADDNDLVFRFQAVSLIDEARILVSSWLEGHEPEWLPPAPIGRYELRYPDLRPGRYRLHLRAANAVGTWSEAVSSSAIVIAPPYWRAPWFFVLLAGVLGTLAYVGQRHLSQRRYARRLEAEVARRLEELRASEARYRQTFEGSQAVQLLLDPETLQVVDANQAACRFYGHSQEALCALGLGDLRAATGAAGSEPLGYRTIERHRMANDTLRDVEIYASVTTVHRRPTLHVIVHDVTERRLARETLLAEKERLAVTLRNVDDGVITTDVGGEIVLINRMAETITGWPAAEAVGRPVHGVLRLETTADRAPYEPLYTLDRAGVSSLASRRALTLITRGGERRHLEISGSPIVHAAGQRLGVVLAFRDVTEKQELEQELAKAHKLEALGLLAGGIAHDFNNLLTVLLGNLALIESELEGAGTRFVQDAETAVLQARDLTQQLLTFARGGAPVREAAAVAEVVSESATFVLRGSNVRGELDLAADLWVAEIDAGQISQVLNNLLINATQAMPEGGVVRIAGRNESLPVDGALPAGDYVVIEVTDQGMGIPEEYLERIFDPYFSTKERGRGLGLASAYSIVRQHDGLLTVDSTPGVGTTFRLYLPASPAAAPAPIAAEGAVTHGGGRVLVMDDDETVRTVTGDLVTAFGYQVAFAGDGDEAIARYLEARRRGQPFDALIMDLTIPGGMGGKEAIRRLRAIDPAVRAIVASGYSNDPVLANHRDYGFQGRLAKPFRPEDLGRVLAAVLAPAAAGSGG